MADTKISALGAATAVGATDKIPVVQGGATKALSGILIGAGAEMSGVNTGDQSLVSAGYTYLITNEAGTYKAYSNATGTVVSSNAALDTVLAFVQAAVLAAGVPVIIQFGVGTFTTVTGWSWATGNNIHIRGMGQGITIFTLDSSTGADALAAIAFNPLQAASAIVPVTATALTGSALIGDRTIGSTAHGLVADDYFIIYSSLGIDTEFDGRNQGELHRVVSATANVITIGVDNVGGTHMYQTMAVGNTARVLKLTMCQNITIADMTITDAATLRPGTHDGALLLRFVDNLTVRNVTVTDAYHNGLEVAQCMNVKVSGCHFKNIKPAPAGGTYYYGIVARGATIGMAIDNCSFENMRHGITQGCGTTSAYAGTTRNIAISNCTSINTFTAHFDIHQGAEGVSIANCVMVGDDGAANGIQLRSPATVTGCHVIGVKGRGISLFGQAHGSVITGNTFKGCLTGVTIDKGVNRVTVVGNTMRGGATGIDVRRGSATFTADATTNLLTISAHGLTQNVQVRLSNSGGALPAGLAALTTYYVKISDTTTENSFQLAATEDGAAIDITDAGTGTHTLAHFAGNDSVIEANSIADNTGYGIELNGQRNLSIIGNQFTKNLGPIRTLDSNAGRIDSLYIMGNYSVNNTNNTPHDGTGYDAILGTNHIITGNFGFGTFQTKYLAVTTSPQTLSMLHHKINCTGSTSITVNLPTAVGCAGREYIIKNSGTGTTTVDGAGSETIDGVLTKTLAIYDSITIESDGANWIIT